VLKDCSGELANFQKYGSSTRVATLLQKVGPGGARQAKVITFQGSVGVSLEDTANMHRESDFGCARFFVFAMVIEVALLIAILLW
jgi:hypothetical protein